jgi:hypothetical protein
MLIFLLIYIIVVVIVSFIVCVVLFERGVLFCEICYLCAVFYCSITATG